MEPALEAFAYIAVATAIYGSYLNSKLDVAGFYFWFLSNWFFIGFNFYHAHYAAALLNLVYQGITVYGIHKWRNNTSIQGADHG